MSSTDASGGPPKRSADSGPYRLYEAKHEHEVELFHRIELTLRVPFWAWLLIGFLGGLLAR